MLKQKFVLSYATRITGQIIGIIASIIVARIVGPSVLGTVAYGLAFVSMFGFIAELGFTTAHIKHVSEGRDLSKCIGTFSIIRFLLISVYIVFIVGYVLAKKYFLKPFENDVHEKVIFIFLIMKVFEYLITIPQSTFVARIEQAKKDVPLFIRNLLSSLLKVTVVLLGYGAIAIAISNLAAVILVIPLYIYLARDLPWGKFDKTIAISYFKMAMPVTLMVVAGTIYSQADKVLIHSLSDAINPETGLHDSSVDVGYYTAAHRFSGFVTLIGASIASIFFPLFSKALKNNDQLFVKNKILQFENFSLNFILPIVIILSIFSKPIVILLLREQYLPSIEIMMISNLAFFLFIMNTSYGNVITGKGKFKLAAKMQVFNLAIFYSLGYIFLKFKIFSLPGLGIAYALLFTNIIYTILTRYFAKREVSIINPFKNIAKYFLGAINFVVLFYVYERFYDYSIWYHLLFTILFFGLFWAQAFLFGWMTKSSWKELISIVSVGKLINYIKGEVVFKPKKRKKN